MPSESILHSREIGSKREIGVSTDAQRQYFPQFEGFCGDSGDALSTVWLSYTKEYRDKLHMVFQSKKGTHMSPLVLTKTKAVEQLKAGGPYPKVNSLRFQSPCWNGTYTWSYYWMWSENLSWYWLMILLYLIANAKMGIPIYILNIH